MLGQTGIQTNGKLGVFDSGFSCWPGFRLCLMLRRDIHMRLDLGPGMDIYSTPNKERRRLSYQTLTKGVIDDTLPSSPLPLLRQGIKPLPTPEKRLDFD